MNGLTINWSDSSQTGLLELKDNFSMFFFSHFCPIKGMVLVIFVPIKCKIDRKARGGNNAHYVGIDCFSLI